MRKNAAATAIEAEKPAKPAKPARPTAAGATKPKTRQRLPKSTSLSLAALAGIDTATEKSAPVAPAVAPAKPARRAAVAKPAVVAVAAKPATVAKRVVPVKRTRTRGEATTSSGHKLRGISLGRHLNPVTDSGLEAVVPTQAAPSAPEPVVAAPKPAAAKPKVARPGKVTVAKAAPRAATKRPAVPKAAAPAVAEAPQPKTVAPSAAPAVPAFASEIVVTRPVASPPPRPQAVRAPVKSRSVFGTLVRWTLTAVSVVFALFAILVGVAIYDDMESGKSASRPVAAAAEPQLPAPVQANPPPYYGPNPYQPATYQGYPPPPPGYPAAYGQR